MNIEKRGERTPFTPARIHAHSLLPNAVIVNLQTSYILKHVGVDTSRDDGNVVMLLETLLVPIGLKSRGHHVIPERGRRDASSQMRIFPANSLDFCNHTVTMFSLPRISLPSFLRADEGTHLTVDLPSVEIHDIETSAEKRPRTLKHLLKANHANYAIIYHNLTFHNHTPHVCCSSCKGCSC